MVKEVPQAYEEEPGARYYMADQSAHTFLCIGLLCCVFSVCGAGEKVLYEVEKL